MHIMDGLQHSEYMFCHMVDAYIYGYGTLFESYHGCFGACLRHILVHGLRHIFGT
jgi:hypothetical protein